MLGLRSVVSIDESGVTVVNVRRIRLAQEEIDDIVFASRGGIPSLAFLAAGRRVPGWRVSAGRAGGAAWCSESTRRI
jgi:hypothetical protein